MQCLTCNTLISSKSHYQTPFHNENLKRKHYSLPILKEEDFIKQIELQNKNIRKIELQNKNTKEENIFICEFCNKDLKKEKRLINHIKSHFSRKIEDDIKIEDHIKIEENKINMNILTDGCHLFLENNKILRSKNQKSSFIKENNKIQVKERKESKLELRKTIDPFIFEEKVNNKREKAIFIVKKYD